MLYGSALTAVIALFIIEGKAEAIKWNRWTMIPLALFATGIIVISFIHPIGNGYATYAVDLLLIFPFLYFVLTNGNSHGRLCRTTSMCAVIEGLVSFVYCFILSLREELRLGGTRVMGHTSNTNFLDALGLVMLMAGLFLLLNRLGTAVDVVAALSTGAGAVFMIASVCRTVLLSATGCVLAFVVFIIKRRNGDGR